MAIKTGTKWTGWETDKFQGYVDFLSEVEDVLEFLGIDWAYSHTPIVGEKFPHQPVFSDHVYFVNGCGDEVASWNGNLCVLFVFGTPRKVCRITNPDGKRYYRDTQLEDYNA